MTYQERNTQCLVICTFVIMLKCYITNFIQGQQSIKANQRPKEDYEKIKIIKIHPEVSEQAIEEDKRWRRLVMNDLENIPYAMFVFFAAYFTIGSEFASVIFIVCFSFFTLIRILYTISYAKSLQPHRTIFHFISMLFTIIVGITGIIDSF